MLRGFLEAAPFRDINASSRYLRNNLDALDEDFQKQLQNEAVTAFVQGNEDYAKNCVEKALILSQCSRLKDAEISAYFSKLKARDKAATRNFDEGYKNIYQAYKEKAAQTTRLPAPPTGRKQSSTADTLAVGMSQLELQRRQDSDPSKSRHQLNEDDEGTGGVYGFRTAVKPNQTQLDEQDIDRNRAERHDSRPEDSFGVPRSSVPATGQDQRPPLVATRSRHSTIASAQNDDEVRSQISRYSLPGRPKDRPGDDERLDSRYYQRKPADAGRLLKFGRVFAVLRHSEDSGGGDGDIGSVWRSTNRQGVTIFSHVCRMVVVSERHGFCWAVPINTYKGQGCLKRGLNRDDVQAHAIIHMHDTSARSLPDEPSMRKKPIVVVPASSDQTLTEASRINFAKVHTIEHNVKFMNIGKIAQASLPYFSAYWKEHL